jgi:hypothetical protein
VAIDFTSIFDSDGELSLEVDEDVSDVLLWERKLSLWAFALTSHIQCKSLFGTGGVAESGARIVIWTLRLESHAASDLSVWPDLALKRLDGENLILEEHGVIINCLSDALVLSSKSGDSLLAISLLLEMQLILIIGVIAVKTVLTVIEVLRLQNLPLLSLFLSKLLVESALLLVLLLVSCKGSPGEFDRDLGLVHDGVVLVRVQGDRSGVHVNVGL